MKGVHTWAKRECGDNPSLWQRRVCTSQKNITPVEKFTGHDPSESVSESVCQARRDAGAKAAVVVPQLVGRHDQVPTHGVRQRRQHLRRRVSQQRGHRNRAAVQT